MPPGKGGERGQGAVVRGGDYQLEAVSMTAGEGEILGRPLLGPCW